ncbi:hypothetical protein [Arthrobacter sp. H41]|uniref:hypothetical protein n=1 Tax=Arthrobacter sp. H41 TaxID=1312978 RepID=UPI0004B5C7FC|nr:hypothetical protein [Arthrobacter sp. H41]
MQHEQTLGALTFAGLTVDEVWFHYLNMGGGIGGTEVDAYLHGMMALPAGERDCVSQAVNELIDDLGGNCGALHRAPYSSDHFSGKQPRATPAAGMSAVPLREGYYR